ncbi:protein NRT1/ PTR FAMILY 5.2-like isoform X1 [Nymphaea colorata]|nr:protein NRT1/ PTR FAMILY 5.2-like isoform X1 [Nymphaea colorata]
MGHVDGGASTWGLYIQTRGITRFINNTGNKMVITSVGDEERGENYTQDGSVDLRGRPALRSKGGRWTACSFIVGYEVFERMAFYGISANLVVYLTTRLHEGTVTSSRNVTNWVGTVWLMPILGAYVSDAHLGRYWTFLASSAIYLSGMCLLTLVVSLPSLRPPSCPGSSQGCDPRASKFQIGIFYTALYVLAVGTGGTKPNISTMGADQFDDFDPAERAQKLSFFNWWMFSIFFGTLFANAFLVYIQDNVGWTIGYGLPTVGLMISLLVFLAGTPFYRHKLPSGSPFAKIARVLVACSRKWWVPVPSNPKELHEELEVCPTAGKYRIDRTPYLSFLDKAAVKNGPSTRWTLCSVTEVEETKQMIRMLPILVATFIPSTMLAQVNTLFVKQGITMERSMGPHFKIPPASLAAFITLSMLICVVIYDRFFVRTIRRYTKNPRGISLLQRMGVGLILHIIIMVVASVTERKRLQIAHENGIFDSRKGITPLSIFALLPQFILMGMADAFLEVGKLEFFYDQAPESMKSLGTSYSTSSLGIGNFLSSFLLTVVASATGRGGHKSWILDNLNESHLDYYYAFFAVLNVFNFLFFLVVNRNYVYRKEVFASAEMELQEEDCRKIDS